ncbi:MAG: cation transporter [Planctomycetaceae bacterium]|nr:cation transporter [Planctomycetaceae bacterium]
MREQSLLQNTLIGLFVSLLLAVVKLLAGVFGRSSALVADAVESLADAVGSILVWQAVRVAARPPDPSHPYGYGKAEALAALSVGGLLVVAAIYIVIKAFTEILIPHESPAAWTLAVLALVVAVKELLFRFVMRGAAELNSDAARADAWHHRSDAITSAAALIGVSIAVWGPGLTGIPSLVLADEAAAFLASGIILITAFSLIQPALFELLDAAADDMANDVRRVAGQVEGVRHIEKVYVRKSGAGYHVDMHLHVDPDLSIRVAHAFAGKVKSVLRMALPSLTGVLIHIEPAGEVELVESDLPSISEETIPPGTVSGKK